MVGKMSFKKYIEGNDYLNSLLDELGIDADAIKDMVLTNFNLDGLNYGASAFSVDMDANGNATIKLRDDISPNLKPKILQKMGKSFSKYKGPMDDKSYFIPKDQLITMLTQGWQPGLQQGAM